MTLCATSAGIHRFPDEDESGAYCEEHGVSLVWREPHDVDRPPHPFLAALVTASGGEEPEHSP